MFDHEKYFKSPFLGQESEIRSMLKSDQDIFFAPFIFHILSEVTHTGYRCTHILGLVCGLCGACQDVLSRYRGTTKTITLLQD